MAKEISRYLGLLLNRSAAGTVQLTDRLSVLLVPFTTLALWAAGARMTDTIAETLALGVAVTVLFVVMLRLGAASFALWRDDQIEKSRLQNLLDLPERRQFEAAREYTTQLRHELSETLARLMVFVEVPPLEVLPDDLKIKHHLEYVDTIRRARELINALSYETSLRIVCHNFVLLVGEMMSARAKGLDLAELRKKMQSAKKITFRLLHRRTGGAQGELLAMLEMKNELGLPPDAQEANDDSDSRELGEAFDQLRALIRNPELLHQMRKRVEDGSI